jgi:hypothetical protein
MAKCTTPRKPGKPHPDFPLFMLPRECCEKKVKGETYHFGNAADDPKGEKALSEWLAEKDDLLAGRTPEVHPEGSLSGNC